MVAVTVPWLGACARFTKLPESTGVLGPEAEKPMAGLPLSWLTLLTNVGGTAVTMGLARPTVGTPGETTELTAASVGEIVTQPAPAHVAAAAFGHAGWFAYVMIPGALLPAILVAVWGIDQRRAILEHISV